MSKVDQAYRWIKERIKNGEYTPGFRLVLATIAEQLDVSVVPVREAIRQLEAEGLVTFERNVGASVTMVDDVQYRISMQPLGILEAAATGLASRYLTEADLGQARLLNMQMADCLTRFNAQEFTCLNHQFHRVLYAKCPNARLCELADQEWERLSHIRASSFSQIPERAHESVREHEHILELLAENAPPDEIEQAVRQHRNATLEAFLSLNLHNLQTA